MYTYRLTENKHSLHITIPITKQQIEEAGIATYETQSPWTDPRIQISVRYDLAGVRLAYIGLYAPSGRRDVNGIDIWDIISAQFPDRHDKAAYQQVLRRFAKYVLGEIAFSNLMDQIRADFPCWMDRKE